MPGYIKRFNDLSQQEKKQQIAEWSKKRHWHKAKTGSGARYTTIGKYHLEIVEFDSWQYNIKLYGSDNVLYHEKGFSSMDEVIEAALEHVARLLNG